MRPVGPHFTCWVHSRAGHRNGAGWRLDRLGDRRFSRDRTLRDVRATPPQLRRQRSGRSRTRRPSRPLSEVQFRLRGGACLLLAEIAETVAMVGSGRRSRRRNPTRRQLGQPPDGTCGRMCRRSPAAIVGESAPRPRLGPRRLLLWLRMAPMHLDQYEAEASDQGEETV